ncbi:hypothetical protein [Candidatus Enterococcus ferrettii]|uniref:Resolvase/invertase-type recombinase catalytic domain-containing protein n=1 Tax=Candidatus Enterococcus ferrettii TaxID=2815324 RepID=A0ABV0EVJ7_9ENTE|nr:hypothetical protein [Enterococcus sp. 665A]MBO1342886.1 hypothetical protein [Enterococcus sp. 665A]
MIVGYACGYQLDQQIEQLEDYAVEELFVNGDFRGLLNFVKAADEVVILSWEVFSRDYRQLLICLNQLEDRAVYLTVLDFPELSMEEWRRIFQWSLRNERLLHPRLIAVGSEAKRDQRYSLFSRELEARIIYREVLRSLLAKQPVRQIANYQRLPIETVYRIKQEVGKVQLAGILLVCFLLAIFCLKVVENYFDQIWLQIIICLVMVVIILWNVLADSEEEPLVKKKTDK